METLGGVLVGAGMVLNLAQQDYLFGPGEIRFTVGSVCEVDGTGEWVSLEGRAKKQDGPWENRQIMVRVSALKKSLVLIDA